MIKLYDSLPCPYGQKVRLILAEKGLSYELVQVNLAAGEQRRPEFLRLNPFGMVPVLIDEDTVVYDSTIINEYLDDEYPEPAMLPPVESSARRARARLFEDFADTLFTPQVGHLMAETSKAEGERDAGRMERLVRTVERALDYLDHELHEQQFLAGEFSIADVAFVPRLLVLSHLGIHAATNRPNVDAWVKRILERPSVVELQNSSKGTEAET